MRRVNLFSVLLISAVFLLSGCVVRTYKVTKERLDQDLSSGNRGYLTGRLADTYQPRERKTERTIQMIEIEAYPPIKFKSAPKAAKVRPAPVRIKEECQEEAAVIEGNRGYITSSITPEIIKPQPSRKYTVAKNDTLQKISQKFYGTTKKWNKIFEANRAVLKVPNRVYPGQVLVIPLDPSSMKEPAENLK